MSELGGGDDAIIDGEFSVVDDLDLTDGHEEPGGDDAELDNLEEGDGEGEDAELEDYEFEGHKLQVSKSVKEALEAGRLRQADYTRKTQEVADQRRANETEREANATFFRENARLLVLDEQIAQFDRVDWAAALEQDQAEGTQRVTAARLELERLRDERSKVAGDIANKTAERTTRLQQETAKQVEAAHAAIAKDYPKWAEERPQVEAFAKANGVTDDEIKNISDPRILKLLRLARIGSDVEQRRQAAARIDKAQQATPVPALNATRRGAPTSRDQDRMSTDDWMRMERARLAKKQGRGR